MKKGLSSYASGKGTDPLLIILSDVKLWKTAFLVRALVEEYFEFMFT